MFHAPAEAHPLIDQLAQGILFESQAKFDRMQAFLDKKSRQEISQESGEEIDMSNSDPAANLPHFVGVLGGGRMGAGIAHAFLIKAPTYSSSSATSRPPRRPANASSPRRPRASSAAPSTATWTRWSPGCP